MYSICTAGHVNHGKTSLVKELTGVNTDRLKEEKKRGLSIEIGFAKYPLSKSLYASIIDTPGHESFVRNMISGAHAVDLVILVVAANEGIKPQTIEHLNILRLLSINEIILVITKTDLVDKKTIDKLRNELDGFLSKNIKNFNILELSIKNKTGIENLKKIILEKYNLSKKDFSKPARLSIDRVFSLEGKGTIITGTLIGSKVTKDSSLEITPDFKEIKIKGLESFNTKMEEINPGSRASINIQNMDISDIKKGEIVSEKGFIVRSKLIYINLKKINEIKNNSEISFHTGTQKSIGSIKHIKNSSVAKIYLRNKISFLVGDKFIIRNNNGTVGGGEIIFYEEVIDENKLTNFQPNDFNIFSIILDQMNVLSINQTKKYLGKNIKYLQNFVKKHKEFYLFNGNSYITKTEYLKIEAKKLYEDVKIYHKKFPLRNGIPISKLNERVEKNILIETLVKNNFISIKDGFIQKQSFTPQPSANDLQLINKYILYLESNNFMPPTDNKLSSEIMTYLINNNLIIKCSNNVFYTQKVYEKLKKEVLIIESKFKKINIDLIRDNLGLSRKYCLAILDKLEEEKIVSRTKN